MHFLSGHPNDVPTQPHAEALPLLQVAGEGRLEVAPDTAEIALGFSARAEQAALAFQQTAAALSQVVQALVAAGIPREQMQSEQLALYPIYDKDRLVGYEAAATLRVTLHNLPAIGATIDRAVMAGANRVRGIDFTLRDPSALAASTLALAVQDAQRQAGALAHSLGVGIGPVWRVEAEPAPGPIIPAMARAAAAEALPILPGTLTLTRHVQIQYVIQN